MDCTEVVARPRLKKRWSKEPPPDMRIVLLGKSVSENSRVGNFLLGRAVFDSEAPPDVIERIGGRLKDRHVMVINSPQLLQTHLSLRHITQAVSECVYLSDPGPHVIVLLLKHEQCSAEDQECVEKVLDSFSERVYQHSMVLTTEEPTENNDILQKIIQKCFNRHFSLQGSSSPDDLLQMFEDIVKMNDGRHLDCAEETYVNRERRDRYEREKDEGENICNETSNSVQRENKDIGAGVSPDQHLQQEKTEKEKIEHLYRRLHLHRNNKVRAADVLQITAHALQSHESCAEEELVQTFLQKLLIMDYRARYIKSRRLTEIKSVWLVISKAGNAVCGVVYSSSAEIFTD